MQHTVSMAERDSFAELVHQDLDDLERNVVSGLTETSDVLLDVSVHVLEHQVEHSFAIFAQSLLNIHQPEENQQSEKQIDETNRY